MFAPVIRGEIWWVEFAGNAGFRPVVIVSRSEGLDRRQNVTITEITRTIRSLPCEVSLVQGDGMPILCVVNNDNLHTIPKDGFRQRVSSLSGPKLFALEQALRYSLGLE
ncbi:MAG: type II toxin-antitoxin system PemK/MazF family toxin [Planctomycetes bacterium]|nr:type II toxin-antitoxin system PemK/MazF family toxin [Planctomycetota bacterium]